MVVRFLRNLWRAINCCRNEETRTMERCRRLSSFSLREVAFFWLTGEFLQHLNVYIYIYTLCVCMCTYIYIYIILYTRAIVCTKQIWRVYASYSVAEPHVESWDRYSLQYATYDSFIDPFLRCCTRARISLAKPSFPDHLRRRRKRGILELKGKTRRKFHNRSFENLILRSLSHSLSRKSHLRKETFFRTLSRT